MKKSKNSLVTVKSSLLFMAMFGLIVSCSKDKNEPRPSSDIQAAIGTFKGTIRVNQQDYYYAIVMVSKESADKVKVSAKTGESYSSATSKVFTVQNISNIHISSPGNPSGSFTYTMESKAIQISTNKEGTSEIPFYFEGVKQ